MTLIEFESRARYQNGYDREFDDWKIIDIHQIPEDFHDGLEIDFYCSNGKTVYLLRLRNQKKRSFVINNQSKDQGYPDYLIAEFPFEKMDDDLIREILNAFNLD